MRRRSTHSPHLPGRCRAVFVNYVLDTYGESSPPGIALKRRIHRTQATLSDHWRATLWATPNQICTGKRAQLRRILCGAQDERRS